MNTKDALIHKILRSSKIGGFARTEVEAELASHVEDIIEEARAAGRDDREIEQLVLARFGNPDEIGRQFARLYRTKWRLVRIAEFLALGAAALGLVLAFAAGAQALLAVWLRLPASSVLSRGHARTEIGFFAGLALGYLALHFSARFFQTSVKFRSALLIAAVFCLTGAVLQAVIPPQGVVLGLGLGCAVLLRAVEALFRGKLVRVLGIAAALCVAAGFMPTCLRSASHPEMQLGIIPIGLAVALSCRLIAVIAQAFDRRIMRRDFI
jgi:hypothetical protein